MRQNVLILVHSGTYKAEFLVIDSNVTILGAGEYSSLGPVYTKHQPQLCVDARNSVLIENNEVTPEWGCNPVFNNFQLEQNR